MRASKAPIPSQVKSYRLSLDQLPPGTPPPGKGYGPGTLGLASYHHHTVLSKPRGTDFQFS